MARSDIRVAALYRYPVKSLTPERRDQLVIQDDGRVVGDRVLGFRFNDAGSPNDLEWRQKIWFASLQHAPGLARLHCRYDEGARTLTIDFPDGEHQISGNIDEPGDRLRIEMAVSEYAKGLVDTPYASNTRHQPLRLVGDGSHGIFHDTPTGRTTMHSVESAVELAAAIEVDGLEDVRFRSNIVLEGAYPWQEFDWQGEQITVGGVRFTVLKPVVRCLATHANPASGVRDLEVLNALTRIIGQEEPMFAVSMVPEGKGGVIRVGDSVTPRQVD